MKKIVLLFIFFITAGAMLAMLFFIHYFQTIQTQSVEEKNATGTITNTKVIPAHEKRISSGNLTHSRDRTITIPEQYEFSVHVNELNVEGVYGGVRQDQFAVGDAVDLTYKYVRLPFRSKETLVITSVEKIPTK